MMIGYKIKKVAFTLAEGGRSPHLNATKNTKAAFTLAEVLITLGIIGVVAAITLPAFIENMQERVKKEQVRTVKYKLTLATDKMKSLGLIGPYGDDNTATEEFVKELKKHFKIAKICDNDNLQACWPTTEINMPGTTPKEVNKIQTGQDLSALALSSKDTKTMGIITGDGTPMILLYSPNCQALDSTKTYTWSMVDNKPETNATTNCISAIFDINGAKKPNRLGSDVRTLNSIFGYKKFASGEYDPATDDQCRDLKNKGFVQSCLFERPYLQEKYKDKDYYAGAVKKCNDIGLHLPSQQTLANIAGAYYGLNDIGPNTAIVTSSFYEGNASKLNNSNTIILNIENLSGSKDTKSAVRDVVGNYVWSNVDAHKWNYSWDNSLWSSDSKYFSFTTLCVGD